MAALTPDEVIRIRRFTGDTPVDSELQAAYDRYGTLKGAVLEILEIRKANLLASPLSFTITGEYAQNSRFNVEYLERLINAIRTGKVDPDGDPSVDLGYVRIVEPEYLVR